MTFVANLQRVAFPPVSLLGLSTLCAAIWHAMPGLFVLPEC